MYFFKTNTLRRMVTIAETSRIQLLKNAKIPAIKNIAVTNINTFLFCIVSEIVSFSNFIFPTYQFF